MHLNSVGETGKSNLYTGIYGLLRKDRKVSSKMVCLRFLCKGHILLLLQANKHEFGPKVVYSVCVCQHYVSDAIY